MLGEVEGLLYSDRKKGIVADSGAVHTSGLDGLSNLGCTDLNMGHGSLSGYQTHYNIHLRNYILLKLWAHVGRVI